MQKLREEIQQLEDAARAQGAQRASEKEEVRSEEDWTMDVEEEAGRGRQRQLRDIEKFADVSKEVVDTYREAWQQELKDTEQRRNDLLPEHQKMQKKVAEVAEVLGQEVPEERGQMGRGMRANKE